MQYNIGITMRMTKAQGYHELRDTIAQDWSRYIQFIFPEANYFFIPNIEENAVTFCKKKNINILILTGGDNIGLYKKRDNTELALLDFMIKSKLPVIGICRGMQLMHYYYGGTFEKVNADFENEHRATMHNILFNGKLMKVNSYHNLKINEATLSKKLIVKARHTEDSSIEAFKGEKLLGLMWHPERERKFSNKTKEIIIKFLLDND